MNAKEKKEENVFLFPDRFSPRSGSRANEFLTYCITALPYYSRARSSADRRANYHDRRTSAITSRARGQMEHSLPRRMYRGNCTRDFHHFSRGGRRLSRADYYYTRRARIHTNVWMCGGILCKLSDKRCAAGRNLRAIR